MHLARGSKLAAYCASCIIKANAIPALQKLATRLLDVELTGVPKVCLSWDRSDHVQHLSSARRSPISHALLIVAVCSTPNCTTQVLFKFPGLHPNFTFATRCTDVA